MMKLQESSIPQMYSQMFSAKRKDLNLLPEHVYKIFEVGFIAFSDLLRMVKDKEKKVAVSVEDLEGFYMAAVVTSHESEDPEMPGNYTYEITFNEEDIKDALKYTIADNNFAQVISLAAYSAYNMIFNKQHYVIDLMVLMAKTIKEWLDLNADEKEKVTLELDGYFVASVEVENGEKVFAITPSAEMKKLIKDDAAKEV